MPRRSADPELRRLYPETFGFGSLFDLLPEGLIVVAEDGRIVLTNLTAERMFGYAAYELSGTSVDRLLPERFREAHELTRQRFFAVPMTQPISIDLDLLGRRKDGSEFPVEIMLSPTTSDDELLITVIVRDITERKDFEAQQARLLQRAQAAWAHFEGLLESAPNAIVITAEDGTISQVNRQLESDFGYPREELLGRPVEVLMPERYRGLHVGHRGDFAEDPHIRPMGLGLELYGLHKDGREFPVEISLSPLRVSEGLHVMAIIRDTSERIAREQELRRTAAALESRTIELEVINRELESFAYSVSHDLRAPLRAIDGFSQALLEDYDGAIDERGQRYLRHVRESAQDMGRLIDDLLYLSRVTRQELHRDDIDLSAMARHIAEHLERADPSRRVEWHIEDGVRAHADERLIRVALENMFGNAWKFTSKRDPARIWFGRRGPSDAPQYAVRDNGAGFDMTYAGKLFAPFQRLHSDDEFEGAGIGLATVQRIIHRHGGQVWATSEIDGGAEFVFTLSGQSA